MSDFLPRELREALRDVPAEGGGRGRMRIEVGGRSFAVLRHGPRGFAVEGADAARMRGLVDLYEGSRHLSRCLVVATGAEDGRVFFEFKRATPVAEGPSPDFAPEPPAPAIG